MAQFALTLQNIVDSKPAFFETESGKKVGVIFPSQKALDYFLSKHKLSPDKTLVGEITKDTAARWICDAQANGVVGLITGSAKPLKDEEIVPLDFLKKVLD